MTSIIKTEIEHLEQKISELRAKIKEKMNEPDSEEEVGSLNTQLDNLVYLLGVNPPLQGE